MIELQIVIGAAVPARAAVSAPDEEARIV